MAIEPKTTIMLIQDDAGNLKRIRIGNTEITPLHAGPVQGNGCTNYTLTIENVHFEYERDAPKPAA